MESNEEPKASSQSAKSIKAISKDTVHRICSGQVIFTAEYIQFPIDRIEIEVWKILVGGLEFGDCHKRVGRKCIGCRCNAGRSQIT